MTKEKKQPQPKPVKEPELKQGETVIVKRSLIKLHPRNPKRHTDEAIKEQLKNFKRVGYLSGIIWNKTTGNLVSGHRRTMALDLFYGNTKDHPVDYDMRVECVEMDEKTEMEQLIYMDARSTNTSQDYGLLALMLPDLDYKAAGLTSDEMNLISIESPMMDIAPAKKEIQQDYENLEVDFQKKKEAVKAAKSEIKSQIENNQGETYVTLSFDSYEHKSDFMERFGFDINLRFINGESFSDLIIRVD